MSRERQHVHSLIARSGYFTYIIGAALIVLLSANSLGAQHQDRIASKGNDGNALRVQEELLSHRVQVHVHDVSRKQAIDALALSAKIPVQYRVQVLNGYPGLVTVHGDNIALGDALEQVIKGTGLRIVLDGSDGLLIVDAGRGGDSTHVTGTIGGVVTDSATGRALDGVSIQLQGTKRRVLTNNDGHFALADVPVGEQVVSVRVFGHRPLVRTVTVAANERTTVRAVLASVPNQLSGVVTTATGVQDRRTVGNDITVLDADSVRKTAPIRTLTDLLEGRVPGLTVQHTSGVPGSPARLRLRGVTGGLVKDPTRSNDPILIVDGIRVYAGTSTLRDQNGADVQYTSPSGFDQIDPSSIDKVEVLKGPSASALWGPDAANGVIVITTKRGRSGPTHVSGTADAALSYLPGTYAAPGYYAFGHKIDTGIPVQCEGLTGVTRGSTAKACDVIDSIVPFQALAASRLSVFGLGNETGGSVTVSGGTPTLTYSATGSGRGALGYLKMPSLYQDQFAEIYKTPVPRWMKHPNTYRTWSGTGAVESSPTSALTLQLSSRVTSSDQLQTSAQGGLQQLSGVYIDTTSPQLAALGQYSQRVTERQTTQDNAVSARWARWAWIPLQVDLGRSTETREDRSVIARGYFHCLNGITGVACSDANGSYDGVDSSGNFTRSQRSTEVQTTNVRGELFPTSVVTTNVGINIYKITGEDFSGVTTPLKPGVLDPPAFTTAGQTFSSATTAGWYVEPRFNFNSRFFVAPGFRLDNGGLHGAEGKGGTGGLSALLPKMDFSWIAVDRDGTAPLGGVLTMLRPRLAFGISGVQPNATQLLRVFTPGAIQTPYEGVQLTSVGNPDLRPERSRELELGFDADFWQNRLQLTTTAVRKVTADAIVAAPIAPSAGSSTLAQFQNLGTVRNTTVELTATAIPIQNASTSWTVNASLSTIRNVVVKLNGTRNAVDLGNGMRAVAGFPLDGRWDRPIIGVVDPGPGRDLGAANIFLGDSVAYLGTAQPRYTLPVASTLSLWRGLVTVSALTTYEHGLTQFASGDLRRLSQLYLDPGNSVEAQGAIVAAFCAASGTDGFCPEKATTAGLVQTVNAFRIQSVSLNYNFPAGIKRRLRVPLRSVSLQGSNVGLWTNYRGKDPDVNGTPVGEAIEDNGQEPLPRTWGIMMSLGN